MSNDQGQQEADLISKLYPTMSKVATDTPKTDWLADLAKQMGTVPKDPATKQPEAKTVAKDSVASLEQTTQAVHTAAKELGIDAGELPKELSGFMHENKIGPKSVKGLMEMHNRQIENMQEAAVAQWREEAATIPQADLSTAVSVVRQYDGDSSFRQFLNETGLGNHPEIIKFLAKVGKKGGH